MGIDLRTDTLFSRDTKDQIRVWYAEVEGDKWRTVSGLKDGEKVTSGWTTCEPTNIGRSNERSAKDQARFEAMAEFDKKLARKYRRHIRELDGVFIQPMLAKNFKDKKDIQWPLIMQPKLDGIRAIISSDGAFSRQGKRHHNVDHILEELAPAFDANPDLILDGELYNHDLRDDFNTITSVVRKQKVKDEDRERARELIQFHVYDVLNRGENVLCFHERASVLGLLQEEFDKHGTTFSRVVNSVLVFEKDHEEYYAKFLAEGYEGAMYREPHGTYDTGSRSWKLMKRKDFNTEEFPLVDLQEGNGNWAGYAKRGVIQLPDGSTCESGLRGSQDFTKRLLADKSNYIGHPVTVRFFGWTPAGKLRFPVITDFHPGGRKD